MVVYFYYLSKRCNFFKFSYFESLEYTQIESSFLQSLFKFFQYYLQKKKTDLISKFFLRSFQSKNIDFKYSRCKSHLLKCWFRKSEKLSLCFPKRLKLCHFFQNMFPKIWPVGLGNTLKNKKKICSQK